MTDHGAFRNRWRGKAAFLLALVSAPGMSLADGVAAGMAPEAGTMSLTALSLAALGFGLTGGVFGGGGRRYRALCRHLESLDLPGAVSAVNGRVLSVNAAMRAACGAPSGVLADLLERGFELDAALVYRVAVGARDLGFSFEPVRGLADGAPAFLTARFIEPDLIAWTVVPPERMPQPARREGGSGYETAPFAQVRIGQGGVVEANAAFRERFGEPAGLAARLSAGDAATGGGRALIERRDGTPELCNIWQFTPADGGQDVRDVLIFPTAEDGSSPGALALLDAMPVALMQFDPSGRLLWSNAHAREMVGMALEPGVALSDLVAPLGRPVDALLSETALRWAGGREMVRLRGYRGDPAGSSVGESREDSFLHISLSPVTLDGVPSVLAVLSDASELRLLEDKFAQSQKMEAVGKLAGGVAHDFNNVLTAISGHSDLLLLRKDELHPDYSDLMQIRQNTHRAAALVRQLLAFSRKQTLKPELLSVQDVVSDTQYLLNRLIGEKVSLTVEHGAELWMVRADQQQLEQALMNLVVNARDAMPGGGTVAVATRNLALERQTTRQNVEIPAGAYVEITIADSGTGIEAYVLDRIFEPFFTTKSRGEGTGLGLSTVYGIVKQSGGYIFAENRAGGGAQFSLLLPRAPQESSEDPAREPAAPAPARLDRPDLTGAGTVLLVEDEDPVRSFASRALKLRGYEVVEAASAEEGMAFLSSSANRVDVLVSDVVMPGMDGPTFAAEARKLRPDLRVVFVSGYAEDSFRRTMMEPGFLFLPKPFSLTDLTAKVKEALSREA